MASDKRWLEQLDYSCALRKAIEYHCRGKEVPPDIGKKCPHHARLLNKSHKRTESDKSYTDTSYTDVLNRLFPWGCETESEVIAELVQRVTALEDDTEKLRGAAISDAVRLNAHAKDITELAQRIEALQKRGTLLAFHIEQLERLLEKKED